MEHASESELLAHVRRLEQRIKQLEQQRDDLPRPVVDAAPSRRNLFRLAAVGVGTAAAGVVSLPSTAAATCGLPIVAGCGNSSDSTTGLVHTRAASGEEALFVASNSAHPAPPDFAQASLASNRWGVFGMSNKVGVLGETPGTYAVHGRRTATATTPAGTAAVFGEHKNTDTYGTGVIGKHWGAGWGMWATSVSGKGLHADGGTGIGAEGVTTGATANSFGLVARVTATSPDDSSAAIRAITSSTTAGSNAIRASHAGSGTSIYGSSASGTGIRGVSPNGRGGVFTGAKAQVNLTPGALATHPTDGVRGDLYMDSTGNLWLCKTSGSTATWTQLG
ncbi:hypothetical protein F0U44_09585 [Nocardioides humilatus]|uniref:Uncharacterized protein n=1 Tax=Nocardioides humilatus TaxID=2607660 RepID=A0A5B1LEJ2_9ACTN|nr:hypothetical protein [Nocardioides humilatus]KAA1418734.1 hypothetical protein F0U44_09585 [Nocardioides humilatus]